MQTPPDTAIAYTFGVKPLDSSMNRAAVSRAVTKATRDALAEARGDDGRLRATPQLTGGLGGVGEAAVLLFVWKAAKVAGGAALAGAGSAAGKAFFENYLAPRLRKLNLLPHGFRAVAPKPSGKKPQKKV
jgi:hypothetical protein